MEDVNFNESTLHHIRHLESPDGEYVEVLQRTFFRKSFRASLAYIGVRSSSVSSDSDRTSSEGSLFTFVKYAPWWILHHPIYAFKEKNIATRLENLMGSNVVHILNPLYQIKLKERIKWQHDENLKKRIENRQRQEIDREKKLLMRQMIPPQQKSLPAIKNHPIFKCCKRVAKSIKDYEKKNKTYNKINLYKTIPKEPKKMKSTESESSKEQAQTVSEGKISENKSMELKSIESVSGETEYFKLADKLELGISEGDEDESFGCEERESEYEGEMSFTLEEPPPPLDARILADIEAGFMLTEEEYRKAQYEDSRLSELQQVKSLQDLYEKAFAIVGPPKTKKLG